MCNYTTNRKDVLLQHIRGRHKKIPRKKTGKNFAASNAAATKLLKQHEVDMERLNVTTNSETNRSTENKPQLYQEESRFNKNSSS